MFGIVGALGSLQQVFGIARRGARSLRVKGRPGARTASAYTTRAPSSLALKSGGVLPRAPGADAADSLGQSAMQQRDQIRDRE
jgi:hypothetical protein